MTIKKATSYLEQAFGESGEREARLFRAELDRRMALPADRWDEWTPGAVLEQYRADRKAQGDDTNRPYQ